MATLCHMKGTMMKNTKKNLLFVFADQWRRSAVGFSHDEQVETPNMDQFANESVVFTNAVSTCPLCSPARASLLTGKHPLSTGVFTNCKTGSPIRLQDEEVCISDVLKVQGYQTGYIGKWHLDEPELNHTSHPSSGAKNWDAYTPPGPRRHGFDFWYAYNACDEHLSPHYWSSSDESIKVEQWSPIHETDIALDYLDKRDPNKPFALYLSWNPPHSPYDTAPEKYKAPYADKKLAKRGNVQLGDGVMHHTFEPVPMHEKEFIKLQKDYYAAITGLDDQFARLYAYMRNEGLLENTLVVLTADHGEMLASHALMGKHVWYEESIGIPLVIGGGGIAPRVLSTVIGTPDIAPTLLSLLDLPIPQSMEGVDCSPIITSGKEDLSKVGYLAACPGRELFLKEFARASLDPRSFGWRALRTPTECYVIEVGYTTKPHLKRYLYNLAEDPLQLEPELLQEPHPYEELLKNWMREQKDQFILHLCSKK